MLTKKFSIKILILVLFLIIMTACQAAPGRPPATLELPEKTPLEESTQPSPTATLVPTTTKTPTLSPTPTFTSMPTMTPTSTLVPRENYIQGINIGASGQGQFSEPYVPWTLEKVIQPMGANWIMVHASCISDNHISTDIICNEHPYLPKKSDLAYVVEEAHRLGLRVFMGFTVDVDQEWSSKHRIGNTFSEDQWQVWFSNYQDRVTEYAAFAEELGVDMFSIGEEMDNTSHREDEWRQVVEAVRAVYSGPITFSVIKQRTYTGIGWWDAVDYIGVHPYNWILSRSKTPDVESMVENMQPYLNRLGELSKQFDRPVIFTEIGYPSVDGTSFGLLNMNQRTSFNIDLQEQADCYRAFTETLAETSWDKGIFWFNVTPGWLLKPRSNTMDSPFDKPAENVIREYYSAPLKPTPTVIPTPSSSAKEHYIYNEGIGNALSNGWRLYPPGGDSSNIDFRATSVEREGHFLSAKLNPWNSIVLSLPQGNNSLKLEEYDYLAFDIWLNRLTMYPDVWPHIFRVSIQASILDADDFHLVTPFKLEVTSPTFLEEEDFQALTWHQVWIPMAEFGPILDEPDVIQFTYTDAVGDTPVYLRMDNIRLVRVLP
jgi:hypothetical protein